MLTSQKKAARRMTTLGLRKSFTPAFTFQKRMMMRLPQSLQRNFTPTYFPFRKGRSVGFWKEKGFDGQAQMDVLFHGLAIGTTCHILSMKQKMLMDGYATSATSSM